MNMIFNFNCSFVFVIVLLVLTEISREIQAATIKGCKSIRLKNGRTRYRHKSGFLMSVCDKRLGYMLAGDTYMKCTAGKWEGTPPVCVRPTCKSVRDPPNGFVYPSHRGAVLNFFCKTGFELAGPTTAFCDGEAWSTHLPTCTTSNKTLLSINCDFEAADLCGWSHDLNHNFDWIRHNRQTPSSFVGTGPSFDHTYGRGAGGHYMYIESSARNPHDTARLISPVQTLAGNSCLEFWYHMYGAAMGQLRVYLHNVTSPNWDFGAADAVFNRSGNHGNQWLRSFVHLGNAAGEFQVVFEAIRGSNYMSDTAIDDVKIVENCFDDYEDETTTTEMTSDDPVDLERTSCYNRCGLTDPLTCSCSWDCYESNNCCPDFEAYCIDFDTSSPNLEESTATDLPSPEMSTATTTMVPSTSTPITTLSTDIDTEVTGDTTTMSTSTVRLPPPRTTIPTVPPPIVKPEPAKPVSPPVTPFRPIKKTIGSTTTPRTTTTAQAPLRPAPAPKRVQQNPKQKPEQDKQRNENEVLEVLPTRGASASAAKVEAVPDGATGGAVSTVLIVALCVVLATAGFVLAVSMRRRRGCSLWRGVRNMRSQASDSQSDVRFLTADEVLDFTIASSTL